MFNLKFIDFNRLEQYVNLYFPEKKSFSEKFGIKLDFIFSVILDGAGMNDYFEFMFYKKRRNERATFVVREKRKMIARKFNDPAFVKCFADKAEFNTRFAPFVKRDWLDMDTASKEQWETFMRKHGECVVKPKTESCGIGIRVMKPASLQEGIAAYDKLHNEHVLVEEKLVQQGSIRDLHPESLNTLRIVTVRTADGNVRIMNANLRVGIDQRIMDNFHQEGIAASVDVKSGIVNSTGCDMHLNRHLVHPVTGEKIIGYTIPQWNDAVELVKQAAQVIPQISYVGWDVAVGCKDHDVVLIEGNPDSDTDVQQMCDQVGKWPDYAKLL